MDRFIFLCGFAEKYFSSQSVGCGLKIKTEAIYLQCYNYEVPKRLAGRSTATNRMEKQGHTECSKVLGKCTPISIQQETSKIDLVLSQCRLALRTCRFSNTYISVCHPARRRSRWPKDATSTAKHWYEYIHLFTRHFCFSTCTSIIHFDIFPATSSASQSDRNGEIQSCQRLLRHIPHRRSLLRPRRRRSLGPRSHRAGYSRSSRLSHQSVTHRLEYWYSPWDVLDHASVKVMA